MSILFHTIVIHSYFSQVLPGKINIATATNTSKEKIIFFLIIKCPGQHQYNYHSKEVQL